MRDEADGRRVGGAARSATASVREIMDAAASNIGRVLDGKYRIDALLGTGGMGVVYRATDLRLDRVVAVKLIRAEARDRLAVACFEREARAVARLRHPNIVTIHDVGVEKHTGAYMVMELLEGRSLRAELDSRGRLPAAEAVEIGRQACLALQAAHEAGVVHRDVKPANVFLERTAGALTVKVVDFGLARLEAVSSVGRPDVVQGTPRYMSPEQFDSEQEEDSRSDLYSLGVVLYEALAGRPPFEARTALGLMTRHACDTPPPLGDDVASGLAAAVLRALEKRPNDRYPTADDFGRALEAGVVAVEERRAPREIAFGEFRLRADADVLSRNGEAVGLERQAVRVLRYLIANRDRVVPKNELFEELWPDVFTTESVLTRLISLLRRTLGDGAKDAHYIRTFHGQGYQFVARIAGDDTDGKGRTRVDTNPVVSVPRAYSRPLTNLPYGVTSFVGRERELDQIGEALGRSRLVTLTGPGGIGKTRLAVEAARRSLGAYLDGVWLVELASLSDPALVPGAVAAALGVRERPDRPLLDTLAAWLGNKVLLLVLDNCEHLVDSCAALVERLLPAAAGLRVLATSRELLDIYGEAVWPVPALGDDAGRLFVERARSARPDFALAPDDEAAIARLCSDLEGIPLSIELAAARVRAFPVDEILARMSDRFSLLARTRDRGGRQRALRATLDWSYDLLSSEERTLLARLSVFAGGWTKESAESVTQHSALSTQHSLDRLVDKSLVTVDPETERYGMLETIREYARERLRESGEESATLVRHAAWCVERATLVQDALHDGHDALADGFDVEHDNMRAALRWAVEEGNDPELGLRLCFPLNIFWTLHGHLSEGRAWTDAALAAATDAPASVRVRAASAASALAEAQGDLGRARSVLEAAVDELDGAVDPAAAARLHWRLGIVLERMGEYDGAEAQWEAGLAIAERLDEPHMVGSLLNSLGIVAQDREDFDLARAWWERSLDLWRGIGSAPNIAVSLYNLGELATYEERFDEAERLVGTALDMGRTHRLPAVVAASAYVLGNVALATGLGARARERYVESLALAGETGDREQMARTFDGFSRLAADEGDAGRAMRLAGAVAALCGEIGLRPSPPHQAAFERAIEPARRALGKRRAAAEFDAGAAMSLDEAVAYALDTDGGLGAR